MAIASGDIVYRYSVKTGAAGDTTAGTAAGSLGKYISTTAVSAGPLNNIFDDVSGAESSAGDDEYRCIFVLNNHGSLTLQNAVVWIESQVGSGADITIGLDPAGVTAKGSASAQAADIATEGDAPAGVSFSNPTTKGGGLSIGNIAAGSCQAIWYKRHVAASTGALSNDGAQIRVEGDTAA